MKKIRGLRLLDSRGIALVLVILVISLIVSLTIQFNRSAQSDLYSAAGVRDRIMLGYLAKSGLNYAMAVLLEDAKQGGTDSLHEAWADPEIHAGASAAMFEDGGFSVTITDLTGRIPINNLIDDKGEYNPFLKSLLRQFLLSEEFRLDPEEVDNIIDAVKDWIDPDDEITRFGAENAYYQGLPGPYSCSNAPLESVDELRLVRGITRDLLYGGEGVPGISGYLTVHSEGKININTADSRGPDEPQRPALVLRSLSDEITAEMVLEMLAYREDKKNDLAGTNWYRNVPGMGNITIADNLLTTTSAYFEIVSRGVRGSMKKTVIATVKRKDNKIDILSWKAY